MDLSLRPVLTNCLRWKRKTKKVPLLLISPFTGEIIKKEYIKGFIQYSFEI